MSLPVHLVPTLDGVAPGAEVVVEGDEAHHAVAVRRLRVGERVVLTDGAGVRVLGEVASTGKRLFTATAVSVESLPLRTPRSSSCRRCPRATAASWPSRC
jgi:16S rRNA (uracil1498-N3)-methyltransferase